MWRTNESEHETHPDPRPEQVHDKKRKGQIKKSSYGLLSSKKSRLKTLHITQKLLPCKAMKENTKKVGARRVAHKKNRPVTTMTNLNVCQWTEYSLSGLCR